LGDLLAASVEGHERQACGRDEAGISHSDHSTTRAQRVPAAN